MISIVIAAYNEEDNLRELHLRLSSVTRLLEEQCEIIVVDDGSTDSTAGLLKGLSKEDKNLKVIGLSRNFGQHAAVAAGFKYSKGDYIVWMDADLQDVPEEIPRLLEECCKGYDIVYGIRDNRSDSFFKKASARAFFWLFSKLSGQTLPANVSTFRIMSRRFIDTLNQMQEQNRFTAGMVAWLGFPVSAIPVKHNARRLGKTKYTLFKSIHLSMDGIISFSDYPLKMASNLGVFLALLSMCVGFYMIYRKITYGFPFSGYASLIVSLFFLAGLQMFFTGITGEYIARIFKDVQKRPLYVVKETINL